MRIGGVADKQGANRHGLMHGYSYLDQLAPVVLFLVFYQIVKNTELAMISATAWSLKAVISRRKRKLAIGYWIPCVTAYLIVRGVISIAVERGWVDFGVSAEAVYFGIGISTKIILGLAAIGTIIAGKPFVLWAVNALFQPINAIASHPRFTRALRNITWVVVLYQFTSSVCDIWLYNNSSVTFFVIIRLAVSYGLTFICMTMAFVYLDRVMSSVPEWPGVIGFILPGIDIPDADTPGMDVSVNTVADTEDTEIAVGVDAGVTTGTDAGVYANADSYS